MNERMLDKTKQPTIDEMAAYCGENGERFLQLNHWITEKLQTEDTIVFPYGNGYGWGVAHHKKKRLICNVFAENQSFCVMMKLSGTVCKRLDGNVQDYMQDYLDHKYPCGDGGWIHYRVSCEEHMADLFRIFDVK